jgi:molybdenum cofactor biosynthesis enzyme MoaA
MNTSAYCSMIHGGLTLDFKSSSAVRAQHCCVRDSLFPIDNIDNFWNNKKFIPLRKKNLENNWDPGCHNCEKLEKSGLRSFRDGMNDGLDIFGKTNLTGPARLDLMFDISCNLACRTCGPHSSTFWQKHLNENNAWNKPIFTPRNKQDVIRYLRELDLTNLRQVVFCGGETLLGQEYWDVVEWLIDNVPNAKNQLTICFQTNGTQPILERNYRFIEKTHLVKLHISIDGIDDKFEYLRWPAKWNQITENIQSIRENCPSNVMFVVEETISIFNLAYLEETDKWVKENFYTNRDGDVINHTRHLAHGTFSLQNCSQEYVESISKSEYANLLSKDWQESTESIKLMLLEIGKFDNIRKQSFSKTFPEVSDMYRRFW